YLEAGCKPESDFRIGTEHEKFPFFKGSNAPVPYEGERSISAILMGMKDKLGWDAIMDGDNIIGLAEPNGMGAISLEPGGQFELSGAALKTLHEP
ncbi:MAG: glutamate-cysteine ligase family protein, partial [Martelella sp.]